MLVVKKGCLLIRKLRPLFFLLVLLLISCGDGVDEARQDENQNPSGKESSPADQNSGSTESLHIADSKNSVPSWSKFIDYYTKNSNLRLNSKSSVNKNYTNTKDFPFVFQSANDSKIQFKTKSYTDYKENLETSSTKTIDKTQFDQWNSWITFLQKHPYLFMQKSSSLSIGDKTYETLTFSNLPASFVLYFMKTFYLSDGPMPVLTQKTLEDLDTLYKVNEYITFDYMMYEIQILKSSFGSSPVEQKLSQQKELDKAYTEVSKANQLVNETLQKQKEEQKVHEQKIASLTEQIKEASKQYDETLAKAQEQIKKQNQTISEANAQLNSQAQALNNAQAQLKAQSQALATAQAQLQAQAKAPAPSSPRNSEASTVQVILDPLDLRHKIPGIQFSVDKNKIPRFKSTPRKKISATDNMHYLRQKDLKNLLADSSNFVSKNSSVPLTTPVIYSVSYNTQDVSGQQSQSELTPVYNSEEKLNKTVIDIDRMLEEIGSLKLQRYYASVEEAQILSEDPTTPTSTDMMLYHMENSLYTTSITVIKDNLIPIEMMIKSNYNKGRSPSLTISLNE